MNFTLNRFRVIDHWIEIHEDSLLRLVIRLERMTLSFWLSVFIPSICLILAAQITLFIDEIHFEATIMVSLTCNLVMYTLYNAIQEQLPADSSLKLIDVWLLHGLIMPMVVFTLLAMNELMKSKLTRQVSSKTKSANKTASWMANDESKSCMYFMKVCKVVVPTTSIVFMSSFFAVGLGSQALRNYD